MPRQGSWPQRWERDSSHPGDPGQRCPVYWVTIIRSEPEKWVHFNQELVVHLVLCTTFIWAILSFLPFNPLPIKQENSKKIWDCAAPSTGDDKVDPATAWVRSGMAFLSLQAGRTKKTYKDTCHSSLWERGRHRVHEWESIIPILLLIKTQNTQTR